MKILYLIDKIDGGGVETIVTQLALLVRNKYPLTSVDVLTPNRQKNQNYILLMDAGINIIHTSFSGCLNPLNLFSYFKFLKYGEYDVVHVNHLRQQIWGMVMSFLVKKTMYITTEHGVYNKKRNIGLVKYLDRLLYSRYHLVVSVSQATEEALLGWLKIKKTSKYYVIHNGINLQHYENSLPIKRSQLSFKDSDIVLISVNRMAYGKDIATILRALTLLPEKYKFLAVGDGPDLELYKKMSVDLKVFNRVLFTGYRTDIAELLKSSDIYIASTFFEGYSTSIIEALAAGIPVIGTDIPPVREVLRENRYLFKISDFERLAHLIKTFDYDSANKFVNSIVKDLSVEIMMTKYYELYKEYSCFKK